MDLFLFLVLLCVILMGVCLVRLQNRITRLEEVLGPITSRAHTARYEAHAAWYAVLTVLRGLVAGFPSEQWVLVLDEVRNGEIEFQDSRRRPGGYGAGRTRNLPNSQEGPTERDDQ